MAELDLPVCPICDAPDSLFCQSRELKGKTYTWYECSLCGSVLLWAEGDQWVFQKVGREDRSHLLGQRMTVAELKALLPRAEEEEPAVPESGEMAEEEMARLPTWLDVLRTAPAAWQMVEEQPPAPPAGGEVPGAEADLPTVSAPREPDYGEEDWQSPEAVAGVPTVTARLGDVRKAVRMPAATRNAGVLPAEQEGRRPAARRLFVWLVGFCLIAFLVLVAIVVYQVLAQAGLF